MASFMTVHAWWHGHVHGCNAHLRALAHTLAAFWICKRSHRSPGTGALAWSAACLVGQTTIKTLKQ